MNAERIDKMRMELRRGVLVLAVLSSLRTEHYGYSLRKQLISAGIDIDEGTLYPLIRRLESQDLLTSEWREGEGRKKRYYLISALGREVLSVLQSEWAQLNTGLTAVMEEK